ncbi:hypothetical protein CPB84DRAFT_1826659 [Gymnopilus junonius]|uniref:Uncharacterized protein n=1 Tax=Gymnopilus junonius TaxID=109634 RepID=A0A9P5NG93_GYMJU|nr:hypothetical protein CPB84DRAFT_1826659 [Gymnopilus junonius]
MLSPRSQDNITACDLPTPMVPVKFHWKHVPDSRERSKSCGTHTTSAHFSWQSRKFLSPVELENRADASSALGIVSTLQGSTAPSISQLNTLVSSGRATTANVTPLITKVHSSLTTASSSFNALGPVSASAATQQQVAVAFAPIISEIAITLEAVELAVPGLAPLLIALGIDIALNEVLFGLNFVLAGVVHLVSALLVDVSVILHNLAFVLTVATLGL